MPSTLLNIADLIGDYKQVRENRLDHSIFELYLLVGPLSQVVEKNDDISLMYILYQGMMMVGTLIGRYLIWTKNHEHRKEKFGISANNDVESMS